MNRTITALLVALVAAAAVLAPGSPASGRTDRHQAQPATVPVLPAPDSHGITLRSWGAVGSNPAGQPVMADATVATDAIFVPGTNPTINPVTVPVKVRIMLPPGYDPGRAEAYPVLYLLHGGNGRWSDWDSAGDVRDMLGQTLGGDGFPGIVVMPEGGRGGWYSDWHGEVDGRFAPAWETFHVGQLVPWVDANFNTSGDRDGRAVAGLSMGGLGALTYAGRYPGTFSAVGSFSGGTDIRIYDARKIVNDAVLWVGATIVDEGLLDTKYRVHLPWWMPEQQQVAHRTQVVFGPPDGAGNWPARNPYERASVYGAYDGQFALYSGQGLWNDPGEARIGAWNTAFHQELDRKGVDHLYCTGPGGHDWADWRQELVHFVDHVYGETPVQCPNGWGAPQ